MKITRKWAMPNHNTFSIKPIKELILSHLEGDWLDPFSRNSPPEIKKFCVTNDLNLDFEADFHLESLDFLRMQKELSFDGVLFDPPYSPRQISECYKDVGRTVHQSDTQSSFYGDRKRAAAKAIKIGGCAISFGWNSGGLGKVNGFEIIEILLVAHGGAHNDTICTVERKVREIP